MNQKKLITDESKERKERIKTKLFYEKSTLLLNSILFMSVMELLRSYILTFEQKESLYIDCIEALLKIFWLLYEV